MEKKKESKRVWEGGDGKVDCNLNSIVRIVPNKKVKIRAQT